MHRKNKTFNKSFGKRALARRARHFYKSEINKKMALVWFYIFERKYYKWTATEHFTQNKDTLIIRLRQNWVSLI